ncbi:NAD-dependent epimerase/dehydratase family protein [Microvirga sp. BT688]|uniref:NAD-dependent epimerase/dehydratase family protein n=1 Tax=Microvirga sp. TaxID=1873136 RepID=UPI001689D4AA|nr:NAD-dependent epimerase/dehydratase family protein [Microvirga sp.]MBD2750015.1 NAD-dependent epimerase/dehydratase family protein [Microvirga sp.]
MLINKLHSTNHQDVPRSLGDATCAILGGGGFLGTNLALALQQGGARVRAIGRREPQFEAMRGVDWRQGDITDISFLATALDGYDTIFHLAQASTPFSSNIDKIGDIERSLISTVRLLELCREVGVKRVIFLSSGGTVYGIPSGLPVRETAPTHPITSYGINKLAIEKYLALYERLYGLEYRVIRLANPYGPFQLALNNQGVVAAFALRALRDEPIEVWGDGTAIRDFIFVSDAVEAIIAAATHEGDARIFNVGSGVGRSISEVLGALETELNRRLIVQFRDSRSSDVPAIVLDINLAAEELGWTPAIDLSSGLRRTIEWLSTYLRTHV